MKEIIDIYKKHRGTVENYINTVLKSIPEDPIEHAKIILSDLPALTLLYAVDKEYKQKSPVVCRRESDKCRINSDKSHYFTKLALNEWNIYVSNPYIHYRNGKPSITAVKLIGDTYYIFDFNLMILLEELRLIEHNTLFDRVNRTVYSIGGGLLAIVSLFLIIYGGYVFGTILMNDRASEVLDDIFKAIIAITLGLAIYDLAKQILEHEVIFRSFEQGETMQNKVLGKFLISIIIALSIEALMVVFKIALGDYTEMLAAFYLLIGVTIMIMGLGFFHKFTKAER